MQTLLVFLKYPQAGRVKTRLAAAIGPERAAMLYRQWIDVVFAQVQPLRRTVRIVACYDGAARKQFEPWLALADQWWLQPDGDLGARLEAAFQQWQGAGPAAVIGTDCPELETAHIETAFETLRKQDVVLGPAADGGYWLVGMARYLPTFFDGIPWSTSDVLAAQQAACRRHGWSFGLLQTLSDVDTLADYEQYERRKEGKS